MDVATFCADIRARGYGLTINAWACDEEPDVAVMLWLDGKPAASANAPTVTKALEALRGKMSAVFDGEAPTHVRDHAY